MQCPDQKALAGDQRKVVIVIAITYVEDRLPVPQARPARAVQFGNTMGGALEEDWVDVGQIGAAPTAIAGL